MSFEVFGLPRSPALDSFLLCFLQTELHSPSSTPRQDLALPERLSSQGWSPGESESSVDTAGELQREWNSGLFS